MRTTSMDGEEPNERNQANLHRFSIGNALHQQYQAAMEEFAKESRLSVGGDGSFIELSLLNGMMKSQARGFPGLLKAYEIETEKLNKLYGDIEPRNWEMSMEEALKRKTLIENLMYDLGVSRIDERAEAPEREIYRFAYDYDGRKMVHDLFKERLSENRNLVVLFSGKTGGGKSYASLSIADFLVPSLHVGFEMESLVYDIPGFIQQVRTQEPGTAIIMDEAGIGAGSRDSMTKESKVLGKVIQSVRYLKHCTIFTLPNANFLDKQVRLLLDVIFDHTEHQKQGEFTPYVPEISEDGKDVKLEPFTIRNVVIRSVYFPLPRPALIKDYEAKRREHNMDQLMELQESLSPKKKEEKPQAEDGRGRNPNSQKNLIQNRRKEDEDHED